jgi:ATP-dependent Clp protease adaptor protein ClpS
MSEEGPMDDVMVATKPKEKTKTRRVPPYNVILLNDDHHSMEFVIEVLCKALGYTVERSYQLMMQAHNSGRTIVWTGPKEVAELKAEQIRTFHEKRDDGRDFGPLGCEIEPAPGG